MLNIVLNAPINERRKISLDNGIAKIVGSKLIVEDQNRCVLITELVNIKELISL